MKKGFLVVIIAACIIGISIFGYYRYRHDKYNNLNARIQTLNINSPEANNDTNFNGSGNTDELNNKNSKKNISITQGDIDKVNEKLKVFSLKEQDKLSELAKKYLNSFAILNTEQFNIMNSNKDNNYDIEEGLDKSYNLWNNELKELSSDIQKNLTPTELDFFNMQQNEWLNYLNQDLIQIGNEYKGESKTLIIQENIKLTITKGRCYYLFFYYLINNNPNFDLSNLIESNHINKYEEESLNEFNATQKYIIKMFLDSKDSEETIVEGYRNANIIWNDELNSLYKNIISNSRNNKLYNNILDIPQMEWDTFRNTQMNLASKFFKDINMKNVVENRVSIALIKARFFYLLNNSNIS